MYYISIWRAYCDGSQPTFFVYISPNQVTPFELAHKNNRQKEVFRGATWEQSILENSAETLTEALNVINGELANKNCNNIFLYVEDERNDKADRYEITQKTISSNNFFKEESWHCFLKWDNNENHNNEQNTILVRCLSRKPHILEKDISEWGNVESQNQGGKQEKFITSIKKGDILYGYYNNINSENFEIIRKCLRKKSPYFLVAHIMDACIRKEKLIRLLNQLFQEPGKMQQKPEELSAEIINNFYSGNLWLMDVGRCFQTLQASENYEKFAEKFGIPLYSESHDQRVKDYSKGVMLWTISNNHQIHFILGSNLNWSYVTYKNDPIVRPDAHNSSPRGKGCPYYTGSELRFIWRYIRPLINNLPPNCEKPIIFWELQNEGNALVEVNPPFYSENMVSIYNNEDETTWKFTRKNWFENQDRAKIVDLWKTYNEKSKYGRYSQQIECYYRSLAPNIKDLSTWGKAASFFRSYIKNPEKGNQGTEQLVGDFIKNISYNA